MKLMLLAVIHMAGCGGAAKVQPDASASDCAALLAQIQAIASGATSCASDGECAVLDTANNPPLPPPDCYAYVNQQGLDAALPLIAEWRGHGCGGAGSPCTGGAQPRCNAGACGAQ